MQTLVRRTKNNPVLIGGAGVGKTAIAEGLAQRIVAGNVPAELEGRRVLALDMGAMVAGSKFRGEFEERGQLTEAVRRRPFRVVLFDEIEKAHPDVLNVLLQIMEDGRLTDGQGRTVDFRNTLVIMTSNLGTTELARPAPGFRRRGADEPARLRSSIEDQLKRTFRPEFLNRIDEVVIFHPLESGHLSRIVEILLAEVEERLGEHGVAITLSASAKEWLARTGFDPVYGARPLRRTIQRSLENPLSKRVLSGDFAEGDEVFVDVSDDGLTFDKQTAAVA